MVITSPPYEGSLVLVENGIDESKLQQPYGPNSQFAQPQSYTRPVDAVVTSPPYEGTRADGSGINGEMGNAGFHGYTNEKPTAWHTYEMSCMRSDASKSSMTARSS